MKIKDVKFRGWPHILESQQFSKRWIKNVLFPLTDKMETLPRKVLRRLLRDKEMISLFVQESTRTRCSFQIAMNRLGGVVTFSTEAARKFSSLAKGESIEDMAIVLSEYGADTIVLRHDEEGGVAKAAAVSSIPIINAGDGPGQHPTQALLDRRTISKYFPDISGLEVALIGDIEGSRTIHSLAYLLSQYPGVVLHFVAPKSMGIKPGLKAHLDKHGVKYDRAKDIREVAGTTRVFYQSRTQTNLGTKKWNRRSKTNGLTVITEEVLQMMPEDAIILHPLPCTDEIDRTKVDPDPRAVYIQTKGGRISQVKCGLFVRMALLLIVIAPKLCVRLLTKKKFR